MAPTRPDFGEGSTNREETDTRTGWATGVLGTACREGGLGEWGNPSAGGGDSDTLESTVARLGLGEGHSTVETG